ncbi:MAG: HEAT repeat domain-containing protein [Phycisphaerales bacterium]|jgi:quinoprotein glucose dehydrogenase|nr:HEAT repeat domain-containing protein [Phycisphaerales bacterium]
MAIMLLSVLLMQADPQTPVVPAGYRIEMAADAPVMLDTAAFCFDTSGNLYLAETQRQDRGVEDNRNSPFWLVDDLASRTVDDRYRVFEKWAHKRENGIDFYRAWADEVVRLTDTDGDGVFDERTRFAGPFNEVLDGGGAGLLSMGGDIWYTNIPHLWRLRDVDGDGVADERTSLHHGFGVRVALRGHDMHGLVMGPDGRVYWSIGDRGYHVKLPDGRVLEDPHSGAVFRCEPDGSDLEVFHRGLRNPQELAFDRWGNLFTGDNNSDSEDRARVVYVAEGGETGWDMAYQTLVGDNDRGPWVQEGIWKTDHDGRPAWVLPPISYIGSGPSGLTYLPGPGHDDRYDDRFLLCDFRGTPQHSSVLAFGVEPAGAGFEVVDIHPFVDGVLCTDVDMGWDGSVYVSDWVQGWGSSQTGRLWRITHDERAAAPVVAEAGRIAAEGLEGRSIEALSDLFSHADMRIRLRAQWELASRKEAGLAALEQLAESDHQLTRLHAIWGLGMVDRRMGGGTRAGERVQDLAWHDDAETRVQAAKVLGDLTRAEAVDDLISLAFDASPRVAYHALIALGKTGDAQAIDVAAEVLWANADEDPWIRHACVMALAGTKDEERLVLLLGDAQPAVRLGAVLALRRLRSESVALALHDPDSFIAAEAARAIHDAEIQAAMPALADAAACLPPGDSRAARSVGRRAVEAAVRRGSAADAEALARAACRDDVAPIVRLEAARGLADWAAPGPRDRVTGRFRDLPARDAERCRPAVQALLPTIASAAGELGERGREAADVFGVSLDPQALMDTLQSADQPVTTRVDCLRSLVAIEALQDAAVDAAIRSGRPALHAEAIRRARPDAAVRLARAGLAGTAPEVHRAAFEVIADVEGPQALAQFESHVTDATRLDFLLAQSPGRDDDAAWAAALHGGDPRRGRTLAEHHSSASCLRCHVIEGRGGIAGPPLMDVGARLSRADLLQSIVSPQAVIAEGYGAMSAMPEMRETLTPAEVRDMVAYLATCRGAEH